MKNEAVKNTPLVYLASPFSHPLESIRISRYIKVLDALAKLMRVGVHAYSPIVHNYNLPSLMGKTDAFEWEHWARFDTNMLLRCDLMLVLDIDGLEESVGVSAEINIAVSNSIRAYKVYSGSDMVFCDLPVAGCPVNKFWVEQQVHGVRK